MAETFDKLPGLAITFTLVALFFTVGILILSSISTNTNFYKTQTITNESVTWPAENGTFTTKSGWVVSVTSIKNTTGSDYGSENYTVSRTGVSYGALVTVELNTTVCATGQTCYITYIIQNHTGVAAGAAMDKSITAMAEIPNNWLTLIILIIAASIIIGIVVNNISTGRR